MVLGLGGCCGGVAVATGRKVSHAGKHSAGPEAKTTKLQQLVVKEEAPSGLGVEEEVGGDAKVAAGKERKKKRDYQKAPIVVHQFPFHSRPGLL